MGITHGDLSGNVLVLLIAGEMAMEMRNRRVVIMGGICGKDSVVLSLVDAYAENLRIIQMIVSHTLITINF